MSSNPPESSNPDSDPTPNQPLSTDELLPPVEPPNAGFILQLFIVPAVIVLFVFLCVMVIGWAQSTKEDPAAKVQALRVGNQSRWQQAFELAQLMLSNREQSDELKKSSELAGEVAKLLEEEIEAAEEDDNSVNLRYYLCRILGEFHVDEGLAVLLRTAREDGQRDVRREAINAIAVLAHTLQTLDPPQSLSHPDLIDTLTHLADDQDDLIRSQTAYAIGVIVGQQEADERLMSELEKLSDDLYADARYNAAIALARRGHLHAVEALTEMFSVEAVGMSISQEQSAALQAFKRNTMLRNAIEASGVLFEKNPKLDLPELTSAITQFVESPSAWDKPQPLPEQLLKQAKALLAKTGGAGP